MLVRISIYYCCMSVFVSSLYKIMNSQPKLITSKDKATYQHSNGNSSQVSVGRTSTGPVNPPRKKWVAKSRKDEKVPLERLEREEEKQRVSLVGKPAEEAAEEAEKIGDVKLVESEEKSKESAPKPLYPAWSDCGVNMLPHCGPQQEIVVDRWHILGAGYFVIDKGESCDLSYKLSNGTIVQGNFRYVRVGEKVDVRYGPFARSIDTEWRDKPMFQDPAKLEIIREYSSNVLPESIGKNDIPLTFLNQRLQGFIVGAGIPRWCGMSVDIHNYLISEEFLDKVEDYHKQRTKLAKQTLRIKARHYLNKCPDLVTAGEEAIEKLVSISVMTYSQFLEEFYKEIGMLLFVIFASLYLSPYLITLILIAVPYYERVEHLWFVWNHRGWAAEKKLSLQYAAVLAVRQRCSQGISLPPIMEGVTLTSKKNLEEPCDTGNKMVGVYGCVLQDHPYIIPTTCHHNLYNGLRIRFTFAREYSKKVVNEVVRQSCQFFESLDLPKFSGVNQEDWISKFPKKRRDQLEEAVEQGFVVDPVADLFVKREPYVGKHTTFKPRQIWNPKAVTMAWVGPVFAEINDFLASFFNISNPITIDCGLSAEELGWKALQCSSRQRLFEVDVSSWDGSLVEEWNGFEEFLVSQLVGNEEIRKAVLSYWRQKWGHGSGVKVKASHGRRSGDPWTSCFNGLINAMIVRWVFKDSLDSLLVCVKGDDNFIGVNSTLTVPEIVRKYSLLGMTVEIKEVTLYELGYCSGKFWPTSDGPKWGVCPFRVLAKLGINLNNHPKKIHARLLKGTMISLLPIASHVPIVGKMFTNLINSTPGVKPLFIEDGFQYKNSSQVLHRCLEESYCWLASYSGASVDEIVEIENLLSNLSFDDFPFVLGGETIKKIGRYMYDHPGCGDHYIVSDKPHSISLKASGEAYYLWLSLLSALFEEFFRATFPKYIVSCLIILFEMYYGNSQSWFLHLLVCQTENIPLRVVVHLAWNYAAYLSLVSSASLLTLSTKKSNKSNKQGKRKGQKNNSSSKKMQASNPIRSAVAAALRSAGAGLGGIVAGPAGANFGRNAGAWVSKVIGSGDYTVSNNSLVATGVPEFAKTRRIVSVKHREYLGDITGSTAFSSRSFDINPGDDTTFPWLSGVASNFQQYRFKGLLFEFVSTSADALNSTNTALGTVVMATQYNVNRPAFVNKQEMEAYEFSCSTRPSANLIHPIECDPDETPMTHLYVRSGVVPSGEDARMYDLGSFQIATVGMQAAATIGELWVTYDIELLKPRLNPYGAYSGEYTRIKNAGFTNTDMLGTLQTTPTGDLGVTISTSGAAWDRIFFPASITAGRFFVNILWRGTGAVLTLANPTLSNLTAEAYFDASTGSYAFAPNTGATASLVQFSCVVTVNGYNANGSYLQFSGLTLPTSGSAVTISVIALEPESWV